MKKIQLGGHRKDSKNTGYKALVDDDDYERLSCYKWSVTIRKERVYANRKQGPRGASKLYYMHREVIQVPEGMEVDHINGNGLDNRKENLRLVSRQNNLRNMRNVRGGSSKYKGVYKYHSKKNPWRAMIRVDGKANHIGNFPTEELAAREYNRVALNLFGEFANLNDV